jgi:hypothetical protein
VIHDFAQSLERSNSYSDAPWWELVYRRAFAGFAGMVSVRADGWAQRGGIDRVITLKSGRTVTVDEKVREKRWPDFLLERWSDEARGSPGWIQKDLACDFIAYAFVPDETCYLLPFLPLRKAWIQNGRDWCARHQEVRAKNHGYVTISVAVPIEEVLSAISVAITINWGES